MQRADKTQVEPFLRQQQFECMRTLWKIICYIEEIFANPDLTSLACDELPSFNAVKPCKERKCQFA
jgi:hypothetical protein